MHKGLGNKSSNSLPASALRSSETLAKDLSRRQNNCWVSSFAAPWRPKMGSWKALEAGVYKAATEFDGTGILSSFIKLRLYTLERFMRRFCPTQECSPNSLIEFFGWNISL